MGTNAIHVNSFQQIPPSSIIWTAVVWLMTVFVLHAGDFLNVRVDKLLTAVSLAQAVYAGYLLRREHKRRELLSPLALYSFLLLLHFAIPGILFGMGVFDFANTDNKVAAVKGQWFVLVGFVFFHWGCAAILHGISHQKRTAYEVSVPWRSNNVKFVLLVFLGFGWLDRIYIVSKNAYFQLSRTTIGELHGAFHAMSRMAEQLPGFAMLIVWMVYLHKRAPKYTAWWWSGCTLWIAELMYWAPTGRKENVILTLILPFMLRYLITRRLPSLRAAVAITVVVVGLFPAAFYYRSAMKNGSTENIAQTVRLSATAMKDARLAAGISWWSILGERISLLESVSASIRIADSGIWPLMVGRTYRWVLYSTVPRVIWPDKPDFHYGTAFGHAAGMIHGADHQTSVSVTFFGEAYLNFLWMGVLVMFVIGIIFSLIYRFASVGYSRVTWIFLYMLTLPEILYVGGTFALYFSGLFQKLVLFGAVAQFMAGRLVPPTTDDKGMVG
jgi:hypothetical protein